MVTKRERRALLAYAKWLRAPATNADAIVDDGWAFMMDLADCCAIPCRCAELAESIAYEGTPARPAGETGG